MRTHLGILAALMVACGSTGGADTSGSTTGGSSSGSTSAGTTFGEPDACANSEDCVDGFCVAPWDAGLDQRGPAACVPECVEADVYALFCIDDAACCPPLRCNEVDGLCAQLDPGTDSGSGTSGASESSGTAASSGSSEASGTDTGTGGSDTSTGSSSG